jgi:hypothetical protein
MKSYTADLKEYNMNSPIGRFLIFCSGSSRSVLKNCPESEHIKHVGLGGTVLFTSIFAILSSGYAVLLISKNLILSCCIGMIWGLMIFNLDRYLVSSMRKTEMKFFSMALPRLLLGILIAFTVAHPIELKIFEAEIREHLNTIEWQQRQKIENDYKKKLDFIENNRKEKLDFLPVNLTLTSLNERKARLLEEKKRLETETSKARTNYISEGDGTGGTKILGFGKVYREKKEIHDILDRKLKQKNTVISTLDSDIKKLELKVEDDRKKINKRYDKEIGNIQNDKSQDLEKHQKEYSDSLYARSRAFYNLVEKDDLYFFVFVIFLLFVIVEIAPILSKIIQPIGPYDIFLSSELENAEKTKAEFVDNIGHIDLKEEKLKLTKTIKNILNQIIYEWAQKINNDELTDKLHIYFNKLYSSLIDDTAISTSSHNQVSQVSQATSKNYYVPIVCVIIVTLATLAPFLYFVTTKGLAFAIGPSLASGTFCLTMITTMIMLNQINSKRLP